MPVRGNEPQTRRDLGLALDEIELQGSHLAPEVLAVAARLAEVLEVDAVRDDARPAEERVPADMVDVQMREDDELHLLRTHAGRGEPPGQMALGIGEELARQRTDTRVHDRRQSRPADEVCVERQHPGLVRIDAEGFAHRPERGLRVPQRHDLEAAGVKAQRGCLPAKPPSSVCQ